MTVIEYYGGLAQLHAQSSLDSLDTMMASIPSNAKILLDTSYINSHVKRNLDPDALSLLTDAEAWDIETRVMHRFVDYLLDGKLAIPKGTMQEIKSGLDAVVRHFDAPMSGIRNRYRSSLDDMHMEEREVAQAQMRKFIKATNLFLEYCQFVRAEDSVPKARQPMLEQLYNAAVEVCRWRGIIVPQTVTHGNDRQLKEHTHNDASTYATALALSYDHPVGILTGDTDFCKINTTFNERRKYLAKKFGFAQPGEVRILLDIKENKQL